MPLSDSQRVRYARHLLLPELGEEGQLRLLAGRVRFADGVAPGARELAGEYLRRAGVAVTGDVHEEVDAVDGDRAGREMDEVLVVSPSSLLADPSLSHAAEALSGAFAAVEALKRLARIGKPAELDRELLRAEEV